MMNPVAFRIFNYDVKWYSVLILLGILISYLYINHESEKFNISKDFITNLVFWTVIFGIIGARLYFCIFHWDYYGKHISEIFKVWEGGLAIHGGIILGGLTIILYCKKYKASALRMLDIVVPCLLFSQALGRWGNFFNQEAYGVSTTLEKLQSLHIPNFIIRGMYINGTYYTPTFFYESIWCLLGVIIILIVRKLKYTRIGYQTSIYLMWYSLGRFFIESYRTDSLMLGYFKVAQIVSVILFIVGLVVFLVQFRKPKLQELYNSDEKVEIVNF